MSFLTPNTESSDALSPYHPSSWPCRMDRVGEATLHNRGWLGSNHDGLGPLFIGDSGIDLSSCSLSRDDKVVMLPTLTPGYTDATPTADDHGTFVCSIAVGSSEADAEDAPPLGVAPNASLAFTDLGDVGGSDGTLSFTLDFDKFFGPALAVGSKVASNSWGAWPPGPYSEESARLDGWLRRNRGVTTVWASGNTGLDEDESRALSASTSLMSPANAKNAVSVGSLAGPLPTSTLADLAASNAINRRLDVVLAWPTNERVLAVPARFGARWPADEIRRPVVFAEPVSGCNSNDIGSHGRKVQGSILVARRGGCSFSAKARAAAAAGAWGLLIFQAGPSSTPFLDLGAASGKKDNNVVIPVASIAYSGAATLARAAAVAISVAKGGEESLCGADTRHAVETAGPAVFTDEVAAGGVPLAVVSAPTKLRGGLEDLVRSSVAAFSSHGPGEFGRVQPTLVAPGVGVAGNEAGGRDGKASCEVGFRSGTSMSAPAVGGAALLLREAILHGAVEGIGAAEPSGALIRAALVHASRSLDGLDVGTGLAASDKGSASA